MGKFTKYEQSRREGFEYFVNLYLRQKIRIPEIDEEIKHRKLTGKPVGLYKEIEEEYRHKIQFSCFQLCAMTAAWVLHDKHDFGREQIQAFTDAFAEMIGQYIAGDYVSWQDVHDALLDEVGIDFVFEDR